MPAMQSINVGFDSQTRHAAIGRGETASGSNDLSLTVMSSEHAVPKELFQGHSKMLNKA
jgi:hypothetical protein